MPASTPAPATAEPPRAPSSIDGKLPELGKELLAPHFADAERFESSRCAPLDITKRLQNKPIALWEGDVSGGACARLSGPKGASVMGVVIEGSLALEANLGASTEHKDLAGWGAFRNAASRQIELRAAKDKPARVLLVAIAARDANDPPGATWSFVDQPDLAWAGGAYHARIGGDPAGAPAVMDTLLVSKDGSIAEHTHEASWECIAVLDGAGELSIERAPKPITPGAITCIPQTQRHAWQPNGLNALVAIQIYTPPGPEQRFKKLASP